jgi:hypothetical protein
VGGEGPYRMNRRQFLAASSLLPVLALPAVSYFLPPRGGWHPWGLSITEAVRQLQRQMNEAFGIRAEHLRAYTSSMIEWQNLFYSRDDVREGRFMLLGMPVLYDPKIEPGVIVLAQA